MITSVQDWIILLKNLDGAAGFPMVAAGLGLMLFGWRTWKICVMLAFVVIGAAAATILIGHRDDTWFYALTAGAILGCVSYWLVNYCIAILGGIIGAGIVMHFLQGTQITDNVLWASVATAFLVCTAFAYLDRQHIVILVTAFLGAVVLISGLTVWIMALPRLYGTLYAMAAGSAIVLPFVLLVPTVISCFYQVAETRRLSVSR